MADPEFPKQGAPTPEAGAPTYYLAKFIPKPHQNERNCTKAGRVRIPSAPPLIHQLKCSQGRQGKRCGRTAETFQILNHWIRQIHEKNSSLRSRPIFPNTVRTGHRCYLFLANLTCFWITEWLMKEFYNSNLHRSVSAFILLDLWIIGKRTLLNLKTPYIKNLK